MANEPEFLNKKKGTCFLAGVGNAELFKRVGNKEYLFASAKTLTESSITIGLSEEEVRAGAGAKLYGKYFHTSTFDLKLTDAMFRLEYLAASVGSDIDFGGDVFTTEQVIAEGGKITIAGTPVPMTSGEDNTFIYIKKPEDEYFATYKYDETDGTIKNTDGTEATFTDKATYCVKYLYTNENARTLTVKANFTPDTLRLYLTCALYSGDDKNPSTGTKIGSITVMVPRFLLKGSQELSMNMTGAATTSLEGSALAADAEGCEGEGIYAKIVEVIDGFDWRSMISEMAFDNVSENIDDCIIENEEGASEFYDEVSVWLKFIDGTKPKKLTVNVDYKLTSTNGNLIIDGDTITLTEENIPSKGESFVVKAEGLGNLSYFSATKIYVNNASPEELLVDFDYIDNGNGTYTITGWKGTLNGVESTEMVIPNNPSIIL